MSNLNPIIKIEKKYHKNIIQSKIIFHKNNFMCYFIFRNKPTPKQKYNINKILEETKFQWFWVTRTNLIIRR